MINPEGVGAFSPAAAAMENPDHDRTSDDIMMQEKEVAALAVFEHRMKADQKKMDAELGHNPTEEEIKNYFYKKNLADIAARDAAKGRASDPIVQAYVDAMKQNGDDGGVPSTSGVSTKTKRRAPDEPAAKPNKVSRQQEARGRSVVEEENYAAFSANLMDTFAKACTTGSPHNFALNLQNGLALAGLMTARYLYKPSAKNRNVARTELSCKVAVPVTIGDGQPKLLIEKKTFKVEEIDQIMDMALKETNLNSSKETIERLCSMMNYSESTSTEILFTRTGNVISQYGNTAVLALGRAGNLSRKSIPHMRDGIGVLNDLNTLHSLNNSMSRQRNSNAMPAWNACCISLSRKAATDALKELSGLIRANPGTALATNWLTIYANASLMIPPKVLPYIYPNPAVCYASATLDKVGMASEKFCSLGYQAFRVLSSAGACSSIMNATTGEQARALWQVALLGAGFEDMRTVATIWGNEGKEAIYKRSSITSTGLRLTEAMVGTHVDAIMMREGVKAWAQSALNPGGAVLGQAVIDQWAVAPMFLVERRIVTDKEKILAALQNATDSQARDATAVIKKIMQECKEARDGNIFKGARFYHIEDKAGQNPMAPLTKSISYFYTHG